MHVVLWCSIFFIQDYFYFTVYLYMYITNDSTMMMTVEVPPISSVSSYLTGLSNNSPTLPHRHLSPSNGNEWLKDLMLVNRRNLWQIFSREAKNPGLLGLLSSTHYVRYWATSQVKWLLTYSNKFNSLLCSYSKPVDSHTKGQKCRTAALETTNCPVPCVMWALVNALT